MIFLNYDRGNYTFIGKTIKLDPQNANAYNERGLAEDNLKKL